jgi:ankyrin repeat protein
VSSTNRYGITPFHLASESGNVDILKILYNRKPDVAMAKDKTGRSALHYACEYGGKETAALKYLVCSLKLEVDDCDKKGRTPFMTACKRGNLCIVKWLLNKGCKPGAIDQDGNTAFHVVSKVHFHGEGHKEVIAELMRYNVSASTKNKDGCYPHEYLSGEIRTRVRSFCVSSSF